MSVYQYYMFRGFPRDALVVLRSSNVVPNLVCATQDGSITMEWETWHGGPWVDYDDVSSMLSNSEAPFQVAYGNEDGYSVFNLNADPFWRYKFVADEYTEEDNCLESETIPSWTEFGVEIDLDDLAEFGKDNSVPFQIAGRAAIKSYVSYPQLRNRDQDDLSEYGNAMGVLAALQGNDFISYEDFMYELCRIQDRSISPSITEDDRDYIWKKLNYGARVYEAMSHLHFPKYMRDTVFKAMSSERNEIFNTDDDDIEFLDDVIDDTDAKNELTSVM